MTRVAVPNFGNYTIPLAASVECLGAEPWCSMSTPETTRLGIEAAPESTCLPFKANLGHFLKAAQEGVEYAVMVNSVGTCRLRYYRDLQQKILDRMNVRMHIFTLGYDHRIVDGADAARFLSRLKETLESFPEDA